MNDRNRGFTNNIGAKCMPIFFDEQQQHRIRGIYIVLLTEHCQLDLCTSVHTDYIRSCVNAACNNYRHTVVCYTNYCLNDIRYCVIILHGHNRSDVIYSHNLHIACMQNDNVTCYST